MHTTVDLIYLDAGGGHRAAALALRDGLARTQAAWTVRLVNLSQVLDREQRFRRFTGMAPEDLYNRRLARGWTIGLAQELKLLQAMIRAAHGPLVRRLSQHFEQTAPDLVVSLIPNFNRALGEAVAQARPSVPFVTVLTDLADLPPHFWIEPDIDQHVVCGTPHARGQAFDAGVPAERVWSVSGMLLRPAFYELPPQSAAQRAQAQAALGLDPARPVAAVMYGGQGSLEMLRIARELPALQLILFTGHNETLAARLRDTASSAARVVLGFTPDVPRLLRLADFFIGKPGPGCLSEALHLGLPVITFENLWTMPQERFNTRWVRELGVGLVLRSLTDLPAAAEDMLTRRAEFAQRVRWLDNRALFEVPAILNELLQHAGAGAATQRARSAQDGARLRLRSVRA